MIAEVLLVLAGHSSSLFPHGHTIDPSFASLLHPGEQQCLESLGLIAIRYQKIKASCKILSSTSSRSLAALCTTLKDILRDGYERLIVETEARVLRRDSSLVARGSFVPLSSIRAIFAEWDAPLNALESLMNVLQSKSEWKPGVLIDLLLARSKTGVHRVANIMGQLSVAVQRVWRVQVTAFLVHGTISTSDPIITDQFAFVDGSMPSCVSAQSRDSILYIGRAINTVKAAKWQKQLPRSLTSQHAVLLERPLPENQYEFDSVITQIRTNVSEWLWSNVLTQKDVEEAVDSLADYFLLRNGEFSLSLIREIERLKLARLTSRSSSTHVIREQDLNHTLLRASVGTTAQHDPALIRLRFCLPSGPVRPMLPTLNTKARSLVSSSMTPKAGLESNVFNTNLLGMPVTLKYNVSWPLDLFLYPIDLEAYGALFSYLSALRKTHTLVHNCWSSLSNSQRARRRWTGLGEGGTAEDLELRSRALRCGWGIVRDMEWFLNTLLGYIMTDVVELEFARLKQAVVKNPGDGGMKSGRSTPIAPEMNHGRQGSEAGNNPFVSSGLDFTTLRAIHENYLDRVLTGCLMTNVALMTIIKNFLDICEGFVAQVERWGGDILPALLFEGSIDGETEEVGGMVRERWAIVSEVQQSLGSTLDAFYEQLALSIAQQPFATGADASKSILLNASVANYTAMNLSRGAKSLEGGIGEVRRHIEWLLLRLDFNKGFSQRRESGKLEENILSIL